MPKAVRDPYEDAMRPDIANVVYPVFSYGIRLKESLAAGESPEFKTAQAELLSLLQECAKVQRVADVNPTRSMDFSSSGRPAADFLGIRYALVAWLDEIFIADSAWKAEWTEHILEMQLYRTRDRAWKFWEQARKAETQLASDSLEVYYLCVVLGFRGDYEESPEKIKAWLEPAKTLIDRGEDEEWPAPVDSPPPVDVDPLTGSARLQRMATILVLSLLLLVPAATFFIFHNLVK
jgi:type VI secretion system protein ImpK